MEIRKGDNVEIITGKDRGKRGKILDANIKMKKVLVEGLNMFKKHQKPKKAGEKGGMVSVPRYLDVSNAMLVCASCDKAARIGRRQEGEKKIRYCKKCKSEI